MAIKKDVEVGWRFSALVFALAFAVYLLTLCPTVYGGDSGDFITAAHTLGIAHPTGYPLYVLLGKLFTFIPAGSVAYRLNLFSAFSAASAAAVVSKTVFDETKNVFPAALAGLALAFSGQLWGEAVVAEVYALNAFFAALLLYLALRFRRTGNSRDLDVLAFSCGLALACHASFVLYVPALAYLANGRKRRVDYARTALLAAIPLLLYLYIPVRALGGAEYVWHDPTTPEGLFSFLTAREHRMAHATVDVGVGLSRIAEAAVRMALELKLVFLFSLAGAYALGANRRLMYFTLLFTSADFFYTGFLHNVSMERIPFGLPVVALMAVYAGVGVSYSVKRFGRKAGAAAALAVLLLACANYHASDRSGNTVAYHYGLDVLKGLPENAVLFMEGDNNVFILNYLQLVEGVRPDVLLVDRVAAVRPGFYGMDYRGLPAAENLGRRVEREYGVLASGRPAYYTGRFLDLKSGVALVQEGLSYRAVLGNASRPAGVWVDYGVESVPDDTYFDQYIRELLSMYYLRKADYLSAEGRVGEALAAYNKSSFIAGDAMELHYNIAVSHIQNNRLGLALDELETALSLREDSRVLGNLCYVHIKTGALPEARGECERALELDPNSATAKANLEHIRSRI